MLYYYKKRKQFNSFKLFANNYSQFIKMKNEQRVQSLRESFKVTNRDKHGKCSQSLRLPTTLDILALQTTFDKSG